MSRPRPTVKHALAHAFRWPHGTHVILAESRLVSRQTAVTRWDERRAGITQVVENWIAPLPTAGTAPGSASFPATTAARDTATRASTGRSDPAVR